MQIVFDESALEQSENASRSITAVLYFEFGGFYFPAVGWNDFVVVVCSWWLEALESLERGAAQEVHLRFMDGPYWITVRQDERDLVRVSCVECRDRGMESRDLDTLTKQVANSSAASVSSGSHRVSGDAKTDARLIVDPSSISLRASGPATGDIVLMLGTAAFPLEGWNDFVVVILEAWARALLRLVLETSESERVHFMEGPYAVDVTRLESGVFRLRAFERPDRERVSIVARPLALVESAVAASDAVLDVCRRAAHRSADVDRLEEALIALRNQTAS